MRTRAALVAVAGAIGLASVTAPAPAGAAGTISMSGSSTALPVVADLAYFYRHSHPDAPRFSLVGGGSSAGIIDAARGVVDVGLASRERATTDPPGLVFTAFALSGVCLVTNRSNRLPDVSRALIQDLVSGRVTSWAQVAGATRREAVIGAGLVEGTGARTVFSSTFVDPGTAVVPARRTFSTAAQQRQFVLSTPGAWSYVDLLYTAGLNVVAYEGVPCTRATVRSGAYPATRPLSLVTRGAPKGTAGRFVRWVRTSRVARRVIATRYVPAR